MGCLGFLVLLLIAAVILALYAKKHVGKFIYQWTDTQPMELPASTLTGDLTTTIQDWATIVEAVEQRIPGTYVVTQDMVDLAIASEEDVREYFALKLGNGDISAYVSYPLDDREWERYQGRYMNAIVTASLMYDRGRTEIYLKDVVIPHRNIPAVALEWAKKENWGPHLLDEEEFYNFITRFDSVIVSGATVILEIAE